MQTRLPHLARAQDGNNRVLPKKSPDDLLLPPPIYHARNATMKIGSLSSKFQYE